MDENFNIGITMINDVRWNKVELCWLLKNFSRQIEILVQCPKPVLEPEIAMLKMKKNNNKKKWLWHFKKLRKQSMNWKKKPGNL